MLFLNDEKIDAQTLCEKFGLDYLKISKNPVFKAGKNTLFKDKATGRDKTNEGTAVRSKFHIRQANGRVDTIQYCLSADPKVVGSTTVIDYKPRYVNFRGTVMNMKDDIDKAIFLALHPAINSTSPIRGENQKQEYIRTFDAQKEAQAELSVLDNLEKALVHSSQVSIDTARILLKAIKKKSGVDAMSDDEVRVELRKMAHSNANAYIGYVNNQAMLFEGRIRDLIDKKVFIVKTSNGVKQWIWGSGDKDGMFIGNPIQNPRDDEREYLVKHILNNPDQYVDDVTKEHQSNHSHDKANEYFANLELKSKQSAAVGENIIVDKDLINKDISKVPDHTSNDEVKDWLKANGFKLISQQVKSFREAIASGIINAGNIQSYAAENVDKASTEE